MKTSSVLASVLLGSLAIAAPVKRAYVTKTEVVVETVIVFTTVWDYDDAPSTVAALSTSDPGLFYEKPASTSAASTPSSTSAAPVENPKPSSVYTPPPPPSSSAPPAYTPQPKPSSVYTPPAAPSSVYTPPPAPSSVYTPPPAPSSVYTPAPVPASSAAPEPPVSSSTPSPPSGGNTHTGDITIYQPAGNLGACGTILQDSDPVVALSIVAFGASTYDYMTGDATNKWCGQKIMVKYGDRAPVKATIMDMCPGCSGYDIDLSPAVWADVTGVEEMTRYKAEWWTI